MIIRKSPAEIEAMKEAGRVSAKVLREVGAQVRPGVSTLELDELAEALIRAEGGVPAFKGYGGFPGSICASVNEQIVHGIPSRSVVLKEGDIISIDTGAIVDGWVGDNAWTYAVGKISPEKKRLQSVAEEAGYGVVREYVGHGIGRDMHEDPNVPNFGRKHTGVKLEAGMVLAIEPMINLGTYKTRQMPDGWLVCTRDGLPSAHFEKTVAITEDGPVILTTEEGHRRPV